MVDGWAVLPYCKLLMKLMVLWLCIWIWDFLFDEIQLLFHHICLWYWSVHDWRIHMDCFDCIVMYVWLQCCYLRSFSFLKFWIQEDLAFEFFPPWVVGRPDVHRRPLHSPHQFFLLFTFTTNYCLNLIKTSISFSCWFSSLS